MEEATWMWKPSGGYGYVIPVPCRIVSITKRRFQIIPKMKDGTWGKPRFVSKLNVKSNQIEDGGSM